MAGPSHLVVFKNNGGGGLIGPTYHKCEIMSFGFRIYDYEKSDASTPYGCRMCVKILDCNFQLCIPLFCILLFCSSCDKNKLSYCVNVNVNVNWNGTNRCIRLHFGFSKL